VLLAAVTACGSEHRFVTSSASGQTANAGAAASTRAGQSANAGGQAVTDRGRPPGSITAKIPLPGSPVGVGVGFGSVWLGLSADQGDLIARIDPASSRIVARIPLGGFPARMAAGEGALWVSKGGDGTVARIDPATGRLIATIPVGPGPFGIAVDAHRCGSAMRIPPSFASTPEPTERCRRSGWGRAACTAASMPGTIPTGLALDGHDGYTLADLRKRR